MADYGGFDRRRYKRKNFARKTRNHAYKQALRKIIYLIFRNEHYLKKRLTETP